MRSIRVLVVDDSDTDRLMIGAVLRAAGFEVFSLPSPIGVTRAVTEKEIDVVVLDVNMPSLRGDSLTKLVKSDPAFDRLRVILVSATSADTIAELARAVNADGWLRKDELYARLAAMVAELAPSGDG
jgi:CheY-like chemotaxis protein